ncbi:MAG: FAD-dependent oxidoreductase [Magnetococcus sp. WYHC-3]
MQPMVIIGTGMAGYAVARELRSNGYAGELVLISRDDGCSYAKPMLSGALAAGKDVAGLTLATVEAMAAELSARILPRCVVTALDLAGHAVVMGTQRQGYSRLVLALGSESVRLPLQGSGAEAVLSVNNLEDYGRFLQQVQVARRVAIIGPGLIGCEFANDLVKSGREVTVIGPDRWPISALLPEVAGQALARSLAAAGVKWHLGVVNGAIQRHDGGGLTTTLSDGTTVMADVILSAVGVRANVALARESGLAVNRGIITDNLLQTAAEDVYALGDCAEVAGRNLPFVMPLMVQARALGRTLTGTPTPVVYPLMPVAIKTTLHPVTVLPPPPGSAGEWRTEGGDAGVAGRFVDSQGHLSGFALTGDQVGRKAALLKELGN